MYLERKDVNLEEMIKAEYFEYESEGSNPGVYIEIKYSELIKSILYLDMSKANRAFDSINNNLCSFRGVFSFLKELNGIDYNDNDFIISVRSSELLNEVSIYDLNLYGIESDLFSLLDLIDPVKEISGSTNAKRFSCMDLRKAIHRSELCLAFSLENLKAIEDTIKVFGKLLFYSLDTLSKKYILEEL